MKISITSLSLLLTLSFLQVLAADDSKPAPSNVRGAEYPRVFPDGRITFRLRAPDARKVEVFGKRLGTFEMQRDTNGVWTTSTPPVSPGFHYYSLKVDGIMINDPGSETFYAAFQQTSGVEVPEKGVEFYNATEVPHGEVRMLWYHSKLTASVRRAFVYTPPGYDANPGTRYPVLYLQHGASEDERAWTLQGRMNFILDNLLAEKRAKAMIVVADCGYAEKPGEPPPSRLTIEMNGPRAALHTFEAVILTELIPRVDSAYRTIADPGHRAFAGTSMGGIQALHLIHHHRFSYYGSFSGPVGHGGSLKTAYSGIFSDPDSFNGKVRLLWLGVGTREAPYYDGIKRFHERLDEAGIKHIFSESVGTDHEWLTWRRALYDFASLLFKS